MSHLHDMLGLPTYRGPKEGCPYYPCKVHHSEVTLKLTSVDEVTPGLEKAQGALYLGLFRWRGHLNWKDIVERSIAGFSGAAVFYVLVRLFG